jgi:nitrogen-specific signal transduction histidine kinase/CheY-like chemotaxis protein
LNEAWGEVGRLQEQIAQTQKMEALGRLAGGIAHDFNNLLTVVQGHAELLQLDPTLGAEHKQQAADIMSAAERGAALNRQLLAFGRGTPGDTKLLDANDIVRGMELILRRAVGESVSIRYELEAQAPILADRSQLEQVLLNLVVNAGDAMPDGGLLTVRTAEYDVSAAEARERPDAQAGAHVVIEVEDDGVGIRPDVLPYIFEPFYSTKWETKGTGLGLATVYGIVTSAGGHLRVKTAPGQGTTIQVLLPRQEAADPAPRSTPRRRVERAGTGRILLVEDEPAVRRLAERFLTRAGYLVTSVADGNEAFRAAEEPGQRFDLLVSDIVMPGPHGVAVAETLARLGTIDRAVFMSGYPEGLRAEGPRGVAQWAFVPKPFTSEDLLAAVHRVLTAD